ncbi:malto-oligosyltrehalose synthase [Oxalobacteraceae bacterium CAVE-383]|nr:malto-oligosyltrehalose synthase [Oxalobacteraceae bacterium CAVE-383]
MTEANGVPRATARLQLHRGFTLDQAAGLVDYYADLGISHLYASPIFRARPGSTHGYDVVDPTCVNPELGGEEALRRLVERLHAKDMGLIIDIVPNHMGVGNDNGWWQDMLAWGQSSRYATWFDVDWQAADPVLAGKILLPFLANPYPQVMAEGGLQLQFDAGAGRFYFTHYDQRYPLALEHYPQVLRQARQYVPRLELAIAAFERIGQEPGWPQKHAAAEAAMSILSGLALEADGDGRAAIDAALAAYAPSAGHAESAQSAGAAESAEHPESAAGGSALHQLLEQQHYRLTWWRNAADEINWRRFFEVSDLAGVRVELDGVFESTHALIFRLYQEGLIDGVRIDHIDGLADPAAYCIRLRQRLESLQPLRPAGRDGPNAKPYIIVEKILAAGESLRGDWTVDGTTGYEFMDQVGAVLHDPDGAEPLALLWAGSTGDTLQFAQQVKDARRMFLTHNFASEFNACAASLHAIARSEPATRDISLMAIRRALAELLVNFPVYRTYAGEHGRDPLDQARFDTAMQGARRALPTVDYPALDLLNDWLGGRAPAALEDAPGHALRLRAMTRFQQLTPPMAAKSVEDTAFYRYGRLLSRNEVGSDPSQMALSVADFHVLNVQRARDFPHSMLTTATHDHKRGEDARARLAVLSEMPQEWGAILHRWQAMHVNVAVSYRAYLAAYSAEGGDDDEADLPLARIDETAEVMLYQTLLAAWPIDLAADDAPGIAALVKRVSAWQIKAGREAKLQTNWALPDQDYEILCANFLRRILRPGRAGTFVAELVEFVRALSRPATINSLAQTLLRLTAPGVPDQYQGCEFWDFSLVDPDNRRPVDFAARMLALRQHGDAPMTLEDWRSGAVKQQLIHAALMLRRRDPLLFCSGAYIPLEVQGALANHVIAFAREYQGRYAVVIVTRLPGRLLADDPEGDLPLAPALAWRDTSVMLPAGCASAGWQDALARRPVETAAGFDYYGIVLSQALAALPVALWYSGGAS